MSSTNNTSPNMTPEICDLCGALEAAPVLCPKCATPYCTSGCRDADKEKHELFCEHFAAFLESYPQPPADGNFVLAAIFDEDLHLAWLDVVAASNKKEGQKEQAQLIACEGPLGVSDMPTTKGLSIQVKNLVPSAGNNQVRLFYLKGFRPSDVEPNKYVENLLAGERKRGWRGPIVVARAVIVDTEFNASYGNVTPKDVHTASQFLIEHYDNLVGKPEVETSKHRQAPPKKDHLQAAARQRRQQQEIKNSQNPPSGEDAWTCMFCEYERIFGTPPEALIQQYEIKDKRAKKQAAERRKIWELN